MANREIEILIDNIKTGKLTKEEEQKADKYVFSYSGNSQSIVSLTMPIRNESWVNKKLHPVFQMNLPEGALKNAITEHFSKIKKMDDIGFLEVVGSSILGRVKFGVKNTKEENESLDEILEKDSKELFESLLEKFAIRSGVSGVQPKLLLEAESKTTLNLEHYIVKSWNSDYPELAANEYFCMRACKNAGLEVPEFYLSKNRNLFIMKRFDIEDGKFLGFEDMCVLLGKGTEEKYDSSYEDIIKTIKNFLPPENRSKAIRTIFKAMIMNHLLGNGDGHLKNYGVLYQTDYKDSYLTPIYDVVTTTIYNPKDIPALYLSGGKTWWKKKSYVNFGKLTCKLKASEIEEIIEECIGAVKLAKNEILEYIEENEEFREFGKKLLNTWSYRL
ncbi:MAG: type II toxin-antitoxin system HipA family toxin [Campylobacterales bacterium]|nr:type II toxin-antitoxin system HipA family toxin [Campylobacterales bacterium]